jgi:hypothetical protein
MARSPSMVEEMRAAQVGEMKAAQGCVQVQIPVVEPTLVVAEPIPAREVEERGDLLRVRA